MGTCQVLEEGDELLRVFEAPLAHVEPIGLLADELFGVAFGGEPRLDDERAEDYIVNIESGWFGGVLFGFFEVPLRAVGGEAVGYDGADRHGGGRSAVGYLTRAHRVGMSRQ